MVLTVWLERRTSNRLCVASIKPMRKGISELLQKFKASGFKYLGLTAYKTDYLLENGTKLQRGKPTEYKGEWIPRSRKHLFIKVFSEPIPMNL